MPEQPSNIMVFVNLTTEKPLSMSDAKKWYKLVRGSISRGLLGSVQVNREGFGLENILMVHNEYKDKHQYIIPLTRHLLDTEKKKIIDEVDFLWKKVEVLFSTPELPVPERDQPKKEVVFDEQPMKEFSEQWAKRQHNRWMAERIEQGWRYGPSLDIREKTNPLLKSWTSLTDEQKNIDYTVPQELIRFLDEQGYEIKKKVQD